MADHDTIDHTGITGVGSSLGAWTNYTPTWSASPTPPAIGNGTIVGRYKELDGTTLAISIVVTMGTTTTFGSGGWTFTLPAGQTATARTQVFAALCTDVSAVVLHSATARVSSGGTTIDAIIAADGSGSRVVSNTIPFTWASTDVLVISGIIEVT